jgi:IclR family KDG regulon transcriptional repressor
MDKTLLKGLMVLESITEANSQARTVDEVAARVGLTRSNTHRTLQTLMHAGYIEKDANNGYRGTIKLMGLGVRQLARLDVRQFAAPFMHALADATGETVHLSVLDGIDVVYIDKIDSPQPVRAYSMVGGRAPAYAVATGKALLAHAPDGYLERYAAQLTLHTPRTAGTLDALTAELAQTVRTGYAVNTGEWRDGVGGIASAVFDGLDRPIAALGVSGPIDRLPAARIAELAPLVVHNAIQLSQAMGARCIARAA